MGSSGLPILNNELGTTPRITSLLIKPVSALCNLSCPYCFYVDRESDPYKAVAGRKMDDETLERLVDTYLFYAGPEAVFAFQGGEPTLAGLRFYQRLVELQMKCGRGGQVVSNSLQTNGVLLDDAWCEFLKQYNWLIGLSLDGPQEIHDRYRPDRGGQPTWARTMHALDLLKKHGVNFSILCVLSQANIEQPRELYRFLRSAGADSIQYIPLAEFDAEGKPLPFALRPEQYGQFMSETFDVWWPERRSVRLRYFDNIAEALAGQKPGNCTLHSTCDSYAVVEYNGDVYPCDFFVEQAWKLGNIHENSWPEIARARRRAEFAATKTLPAAECQVCEFASVCKGGCPKLRQGPQRRFEDLDYFCPSYKTIFRKVIAPLKRDVQAILRASSRP